MRVYWDRARRIACLSCGIFCAVVATADVYTYQHENVLGTSFELRVRSETKAAADGAESRALDEIDRLNAILSRYDSGSEFRRLEAVAGTMAPASNDLRAVLSAGAAWRNRTDGAFNPGAAAIAAVWEDGADRGVVPSADEVTMARNRAAAASWSVDNGAGLARVDGEAPLSFDGLAKGYVIDRVCAAVLAEASVSGVLVNIGGDLKAAGAMTPWVGIADPFRDSETSASIATVPVMDGAVATSGGYQRFVEIGGERYSHIYDPRTGLPVSEVVSATVIAPSAVDADALATAFNVLPMDESLAMADGLDGVACLVVDRDGGVGRSARWTGAAPERLVVAQAAEAVADGETAHWSDRFALTIAFEVANPESDGRYRRPYVGIWICDDEGFPIRTLVLWLQDGGRRWLPNLREWYRDDQIRYWVDERDLVRTVSRSTRPPGSYDVVWDGKDDHGVAVPEGQYTVVIEAVREHGTHESLRKEVVLGSTAFTEELAGKVEIGRATIAYDALEAR